MHNLFRDPHESEEVQAIFGEKYYDILPFERIVDTAYFATKSETSLLQVAATRRHMTGMDKEGYFASIAPMVVKYPDDLGSYYDPVFSSEQSS